MTIAQYYNGTSLLTAYGKHIIAIMETHSPNIIDDFAVMSINPLRILWLLLLIRIRAKGKAFFMGINSYVVSASRAEKPRKSGQFSSFTVQ